MNRYPLLAFSALTLAFAPAAWATVTAITPEASQVVLVDGKATVRFTVTGQNEDTDCGIWVSYGDNGSPDTRVIGNREGKFPRQFEYTFSRPGQFTVVAKGERVKQTFACGGEASTSITVVEGRSRRYGATVSCPDGWQLSENSLNRQTGAYTCSPAYPAQQMDCGPGLRYFERDNLIGCRSTGNNRR